MGREAADEVPGGSVSPAQAFMETDGSCLSMIEPCPVACDAAAVPQRLFQMQIQQFKRDSLGSLRTPSQRPRNSERHCD